MNSVGINRLSVIRRLLTCTHQPIYMVQSKCFSLLLFQKYSSVVYSTCTLYTLYKATDTCTLYICTPKALSKHSCSNYFANFSSSKSFQALNSLVLQSISSILLYLFQNPVCGR